jgi:hypothetical protein
MRLVSPHSHSSRRFGSCAKTLLIVGVGFMILVTIITVQGQKAQQEALAAADALYSTKPAEAVAKYKIGYPTAGSRKAEVLQRIVDQEAEGNAAEATKWIERGLDEQVAVTYKSAASRTLVAKVEKDRTDRAAAKQAETAAKAKQNDEQKGARDQIRANKNLPRDQFRAVINGRTKQQVLDALGKPDQTQDQEGLGELWYYNNSAVDPVTGKKTAIVQVVFENGTVTMVNFN